MNTAESTTWGEQEDAIRKQLIADGVEPEERNRLALKRMTDVGLTPRMAFQLVAEAQDRARNERDGLRLQGGLFKKGGSK